jgi:type IV pilus assembly protein PilY1
MKAVRRWLPWLGFSMIGCFLAAAPLQGANTNSDYAGISPFVASTVIPNVLILMDNSGSMGYRARCDDTTNQSAPSFNQCPGGGLFDEMTTVTGLFDSMACYAYDAGAGNTRFVASGAPKTAINTPCGSTLWDGNFLNWVTFRRGDALKKALIGSHCAVTRASDGTCPPSGSPASITLKGQASFGPIGSACCANVSTPTIQSGSGVNNANGRVPATIQTLGASPAKLVFHVRGTGTLAGSFCVANPADGLLSSSASSCAMSGGSGFTEQQFVIRVAVSTEPQGVIQQLGDKARFGLLEFRQAGDGGKVLTPVGSTQSVPYDSTTVTTYNSNKSAMIAGIEQTSPATWTPLAETLYTGVRYIAQLPQPFGTSSYLYPIAYSPGGPSFPGSSSGAGTLGPAEITAISTGENCPSGYITKACGRDPFFFGSNPAPGWASPSQQVPCCKTFIMILTDGEPTTDANIPGALQDYGHNAHGTHCTGSSAAIPPPTGTCGTNPAIPAATLIKQHKVDYDTALHSLDDVAYWAHINDLRQAVVPVINEAGHDLPGFQNVTVYTFYAFGNINGREILMQTARQGGFEDQNGNNLPDLQSEWDKVNNDTGLLSPDGIPDTYFESSNADDIRDKLLSALTSVLQKSASGTAVSVLASSSTGEGAMYQAYFYPVTFNKIGSSESEVMWTGFTQGMFVDFYGNIREDFSGPDCTGPPDGKLVLSEDCIIKLRVDSTGNVLVDRFKDENGVGIAEATTPFQTVTLREIQPIWEAGRRLALTDPDITCPANTGGVTCRRILTWMDVSNGGGVGPSSEEYNEFGPTRVGYLCPYLGGSLVLDCNSSNVTNKTNALSEATNIINFIRGFQVAGFRDRQLNVLDDTGAGATKVWKLGDIINSTPVIVSAPRERYDAIYGDATYTAFYKRYKDRRQVTYVGANDGMLHAFNAGFFTLGDDVSTTSVIERARFTTSPMQPGTSTPCSALPCDASVSQYSYRTNNPKLGAELWGFIPQDLLPQLRWLTLSNYDHAYYVDLTPKVTDARIFANDADHPGGWGTILIGGFRLGGSCTNCLQGKGGPRVVTADFNYNGTTTDVGSSASGSDTRVFLSSYFVLDITNPEKDPVLLWVFRDKDLGLSTAAPAVLRVNPATDPSTSSTNERWYVVFGSGPTHMDGSSNQTAKLFIVDLRQGPNFTAINQTSGTVGGTACSLVSPCIAVNTTSSNENVRVFSTGETGASMGNPVTLDYQLDYRVDAIYAGILGCAGSSPSPCNGSAPQWRGAMYRLLTNKGNPDPDTWGLAGAPTKLISTFAYSTSQSSTCASVSPCRLGPVIGTPGLALDDLQNLWVYFGSGRFYSNEDKTNQDKQHFFGIKDCVVTGICTNQTIERNNLLNVSSVVVCSVCTGSQVTGLTGVTSFDGSSGTSLMGSVSTRDGWVTTLPASGERSLTGAKILGGNVFFTSFAPTKDVCIATGQGYLYALFYQTGTAYKDSVIGTTPSGSDLLVNRSLALDTGLPSQMAIQVGAQGTGAAGTSSNAGSIGRVTGFIQSSSGVLGQLGVRPAFSPWSRIISWRDL